MDIELSWCRLLGPKRRERRRGAAVGKLNLGAGERPARETASQSVRPSSAANLKLENFLVDLAKGDAARLGRRHAAAEGDEIRLYACILRCHIAFVLLPGERIITFFPLNSMTSDIAKTGTSEPGTVWTGLQKGRGGLLISVHSALSHSFCLIARRKKSTVRGLFTACLVNTTQRWTEYSATPLLPCLRQRRGPEPRLDILSIDPPAGRVHSLFPWTRVFFEGISAQKNLVCGDRLPLVGVLLRHWRHVASEAMKSTQPLLDGSTWRVAGCVRNLWTKITIH